MSEVPATITVFIGQSFPFTSYFTDSYGNPQPAMTVLCSSSAPQIVSVTNNSFTPDTNNTQTTQVATAIANGVAILTVQANTANGVLTNTITVTVDSPSPTIISFVLGQPSP